MKQLLAYVRRVGFGVAGLLFATFVISPSALAATPGSIGSWQTTTVLPQDIGSGDAVLANNGYVYYLGGDGIGTDVYYAKLNSNGTVGAWTTSSSSLPVGRELGAAVSTGGYLYMMGGYDGSDLNTVYYAKVNSDGSTTSWTLSGNTLPQTLEGATAVTINGYIYVIGGDHSNTPISTVYYAKIGTGGVPGAWQTSGNVLPNAVGGPVSVTDNGYVYVMGGVDNSPNNLTDIYSAPLNATTGAVGTWTTSPNAMPVGVSDAAVALVNNYAYVMGGESNSGFTGAVSYAKLNSDGSVGTWSASSNTLPQSLLSPAAVAANSYVDVLGGYVGGPTYTDTVYYALATGDPIVTAAAATTSTSTTTAAPDTGYGASSKTNMVTQAAAIVATSAVGFGLLMLRRQKNPQG